ncbi:hypothetical protein GX51_00491 [Blastomyces parvus]|uniref:Uncharacterized protein n=1 Tax=Blastomyces parvus TaxID=2060905 RepID=A0A2B7XDR9_9EURO|nr:hypothetical protein GX51_00491 [Blastomyces parvus]
MLLIIRCIDANHPERIRSSCGASSTKPVKLWVPHEDAETIVNMPTPEVQNHSPPASPKIKTKNTSDDQLLNIKIKDKSDDQPLHISLKDTSNDEPLNINIEGITAVNTTITINTNDTHQLIPQ